MSSKRPSLINNALLNGITQICKIIFPIISFSYSAHVLGAEKVGIFQFSSSIVGYFAIVASLGISIYAIREGAAYRDRKEDFEKFASEIFSINVMSMVLSYLLLAILFIFWGKLSNYTIYIIINALTIFFTTIGANWINTIYEDYLYLTTRFVSVQIISIILLILFVKSKEDLLLYTIIKVFAASAGEFLNYFHIRKYAKLKFTTNIDYKRHLKPIFILFANEIAVTIYVNSDITIIGTIKDDKAVGIYSTAAQLYNIVKRLVYSFVTVTVPRFSYLIAQNNRKEAEQLYERIGNILFLVAVPACVGIISSGKELLYILAGEEFVSGYFALCILSPAIVLASFSNLFCLCALVPYKQDMMILYASIAATVVNIGLNFILIPAWGIEAAALTTLIAELIVFLVYYHKSRAYFKFKLSINNLVSVLIGSFSIYLVCLFIERTTFSLMIKLIVEVGLSVVIYFTILYVAKNKYFMTILDSFISKIMRKIKRKTV